MTKAKKQEKPWLPEVMDEANRQKEGVLKEVLDRMGVSQEDK